MFTSLSSRGSVVLATVGVLRANTRSLGYGSLYRWGIMSGYAFRVHVVIDDALGGSSKKTGHRGIVFALPYVSKNLKRTCLYRLKNKEN